ncbi:MAG TPA: RNA polymerase sigma factor [Vicinamibacterales bacterium]|nr:RNA polymerase sigma factor [Vicinamibacterales bacterium]
MNALPVADVLPIATPGSSAERLSALFDAHYERLYRLARRLVPTADAAQDLVQETFLRAARAPRSVPSGVTAEEAWLVRVLINVRRDEWRKESVRRRHDEPVPRDAQLQSDHEAACVARATVWRALDRLTPRRRAVIVMHEIEGLTVAAIASLLRISAITVRWHLSIGRRELVTLLRPRMGEGDEKR